MSKQEEKGEMISYRKSCRATGTGIPHYILMDDKADETDRRFEGTAFVQKGDGRPGHKRRTSMNRLQPNIRPALLRGGVWDDWDTGMSSDFEIMKGSEIPGLPGRSETDGVMGHDILLRELATGAFFPFRLGTTSYILPADLVPNVEFLAPLVDDVELVLFESEPVSNLPDLRVIERLVDLKRANRISYTVHLPLDVQLGNPDEERRRHSVEKCLKVINITRPLAPFAYIVHFHGEQRGGQPAQNIKRWSGALDRSVCEMLEAGIEPDLLCVETLDYPFEHVAGIVSRHHLSICLDIGHLLLYGYSLEQYFRMYLRQCKVMHLHGICNGADHCHIGMLDEGIVQSVLDRLCSHTLKERVLTIEVFNQQHLEKSLDVLAGVDQWQRLH